MKEGIDNAESFKKVISAVTKNGIGFKKFFFRTNMSYDELLKNKFPVDDHRDGNLIVKFSDGENFIGGFMLSYAQFESVTETLPVDEDIEKEKCLFSLVDFGDRILGDTKQHVEIHLRFNNFNCLDGTTGTAIVEVYPSDRKLLKQWQAEGIITTYKI